MPPRYPIRPPRMRGVVAGERDGYRPGMAWVHVVIDVPDDEHAASAAFWERLLGWPIGQPWDGHPELQSFEPANGTPYVHLQRVDAAPRVHLDLESADPEETVGRALDLGAELVDEQDRWRTLASPGGLPFCVLEDADHAAPEPVTWPDGHRSRLVQVCVDSPGAVHDREVAFWRDLLGPAVGRFRGRRVRRQGTTTLVHRSSCCSSVSMMPAGRPARTSTTAPTTWPPRYAGSATSVPATSVPGRAGTRSAIPRGWPSASPRTHPSRRPGATSDDTWLAHFGAPPAGGRRPPARAGRVSSRWSAARLDVSTSPVRRRSPRPGRQPCRLADSSRCQPG